MLLKNENILLQKGLGVRRAFFYRLCAHAPHNTRSKEKTLSKIARRKFIQLSAVAAAGCFVNPGREAVASDLPQLSEDDPMAKAMKYVHDATTVDPSTRNNPAPEQNCANCALIQGNEGDTWRPCQIFPGKAVNAAGWCSVWAPKA